MGVINNEKMNTIPSVSVSRESHYKELAKSDTGRVYYPISLEGRKILIEQLASRNA